MGQGDDQDGARPVDPGLTPAPLADLSLPCPCGGGGLGVAGFHYRAAPGCCYGPTPQPAPALGGQSRADVAGKIVDIKRREGAPERYVYLVVHRDATGDEWRSLGMIERLWPVLLPNATDALLARIGRAPRVVVDVPGGDYAERAERLRMRKARGAR